MSARARLRADADGARALLASVPAQAWVALTVVLATLVYALAGRSVAAPSVFADELIHSELAKSVAAGGVPAVRGEVWLAHGLVAPLLGGAAYAVGGDPVAGYAAVKALNALVMSLAAVPTFLLARRVVTPGWAAAVAALSVAVPSMVFSSLVMTEPVFYPVFLVAVLALVRVIEQPTNGRQLALLAAIALACLTRAQALALVPGVLGALVLHAWFERMRTPGRTPVGEVLRRYRLLWGALACAVVCVAAVGVSRGSVGEVLGRRAGMAQWYSPAATLRWSLANLADLGLYAGIVTLAVLPLALHVALGRATSTPASRIWAATTISIGLTTLAMVGAFSGSSHGSATIHDRNLFYLVPLLLIGLALWIRAGSPRPWKLVAVSCAAVVGLPLAIPLRDVADDTWVEHLGIQPWIVATGSAGIAITAMVALAAVAAAAVAFLPARRAWLLIAIVALSFWIGGTAAASEAERYGRYEEPAPGWIDDAVAPGAAVTLLHVDPRRCVEIGARGHRWLAYWRTEFFNRSVGPVVVVGQATGVNVAETVAGVGRDGVLLDVNGRPVRSTYVVTDARLPLVGATLVSRSALEGLALWRVGGDVRLGLSSEPRVVGLLCSARGS